MKIRTMIAAAMSVALLTVFVAAPVSAGSPATAKVAQRGVEYAVSTLATNCPQFSLVGAVATRSAPARSAVDAALKLKAGTRAKSQEMYPCGDVQVKFGQDYYFFMAKTAAYAFGQAGSGWAYTGLGVDGPVTGIWGWYARWNDTFFDWDMISIADPDFGGPLYLPAILSGDWSDLAFGGSLTWVPSVGWLEIGTCGSLGPWGRVSTVDTGGVDPGDGWTVDQTSRYRQCYPSLGDAYNPPVNGGVTLNGNDATGALMELSRSVVTAVDVFPW